MVVSWFGSDFVFKKPLFSAAGRLTGLVVKRRNASLNRISTETDIKN